MIRIEALAVALTRQNKLILAHVPPIASSDEPVPAESQ
jgi:hypothetical protein